MSLSHETLTAPAEAGSVDSLEKRFNELKVEREKVEQSIRESFDIKRLKVYVSIVNRVHAQEGIDDTENILRKRLEELGEDYDELKKMYEGYLAYKAQNLDVIVTEMQQVQASAIKKFQEDIKRDIAEAGLFAEALKREKDVYLFSLLTEIVQYEEGFIASGKKEDSLDSILEDQPADIQKKYFGLKWAYSELEAMEGPFIQGSYDRERFVYEILKDLGITIDTGHSLIFNRRMESLER
ncbi:MAG: hypothetical protein HGB03_02790 [Candidatus Yonathbacteria bacterium]|nr:hypothetical protein [Candidatus Yonathbacteria bacterium]NTW47437.1 hypothetical protein [Candidatus Yonathbacteria bacterium]